LSTFGRAMAAPLASLPPWRRRLRRPISACGIVGVAVIRGGFCRWRDKAAGAGGWLEGGCRALVAAAKIMPAARSLRLGVGSGCLKQTAAAGVASQLLVRCGTASEDGAHSNVTVGRLGLQRTVARCSASLGDSGAVHRRKMARTTTWFAGMMAETVCAGDATR
jgi:hypothetical protein